jgi:hypothetical protein
MEINKDNDIVLFQMKMKRSFYEDLEKKAEASGLDRSSYVKLLISKVGVEAVVGGRFLKDQRRIKRIFKQEAEALGVAEGHALRALSGDYNILLAVNELWIYNKGWIKQLINQYCYKYDLKLTEFVLNKTIARVIIKAYFEIEDIVERKRGYTRGAYKLKPDYAIRDMEKLEKRMLHNDALTFDRLFKQFDKELANEPSTQTGSEEVSD